MAVQYKTTDQLLDNRNIKDQMKKLNELDDAIENICEMYTKQIVEGKSEYGEEIKKYQNVISNAINGNISNVSEFKDIYARIDILNQMLKNLESKKPEKSAKNQEFTIFAKEIRKQIDGIEIKGIDGKVEYKEYGKLGWLNEAYKAGFIKADQIKMAQKLQQEYEEKAGTAQNEINVIEENKASIDNAFERKELEAAKAVKDTVTLADPYKTILGNVVKLDDVTIAEPSEKEKEQQNKYLSELLGTPISDVEFLDRNNVKISQEIDLTDKSIDEKVSMYIKYNKDELAKKISEGRSYPEGRIITEIELVDGGKVKVSYSVDKIDGISSEIFEIGRLKDILQEDKIIVEPKTYTREELKKLELEKKQELLNEKQNANKNKRRANRVEKKYERSSMDVPEYGQENYQRALVKPSKFRDLWNKIAHPIRSYKQRKIQKVESEFNIEEAQKTWENEKKSNLGIARYQLNEEERKKCMAEVRKISEGYSKKPKKPIEEKEK